MGLFDVVSAAYIDHKLNLLNQAHHAFFHECLVSMYHYYTLHVITTARNYPFHSPFVGFSVYVLSENLNEDITLKAHRPKEIVTITLCLWVYIAANTSKATVLSFGDKLRLKIYYENDSNFRVNFYNWNR